MRFTLDRCLECGTPGRTTTSLESRYLDSTGRFIGSDYWFCSASCFHDAVRQFIPRKYQYEKATDDPETKKFLSDIDKQHGLLTPATYGYKSINNEIATYVTSWETAQQSAIDEALATLQLRILDESSHKYEEQRSKQSVKAEEEQRRLSQLAEEEKAHAQLIAPRTIPEHIRVHTAIIAKTGWGKTQVLFRLIHADLKKDNPPSMVIIDSTGAIVKRLQRLALFNEKLKDRLLIIDPSQSPSLNLFDISNPRFTAYSPEQRESVLNDIVGLFKYVFGSKEYDLTGQQGLAFEYAVRLILQRPASTLTDLRKLLEEKARSWEKSAFAEDIRRMDVHAQDFYQNHFFEEALYGTRASIARRIHSMITYPAFARMFTAATNALDLFAETQDKGSIVLVNTNQALLKTEYITFGRYIVARVFNAVLERAELPENKRRTTHLIIDEAGPYFDDTFDALLTQVRQYGLKVTVAFQHFDQLDDKLKNSVSGQTSVKYVGMASTTDMTRIAAQIRCDKEFLADLSIDETDPPKWSEWAVFYDGLKHPMKMRLDFGVLNNETDMSAAELEILLDNNRRRLSSPMPKSKTEPAAIPEPSTKLKWEL